MLTSRKPQSGLSALKANRSMNAQGGSALRAGSSFRLKGQETVNPLLFDHSQIFKETGMVLCPVPFIQVFSP